MTRGHQGIGELANAMGRVAFAPEVTEELARAWLADYPNWFEAEHTPVPGAGGAPDLALRETPLGPVVAKREVPRGWKASLVKTGARPFKSGRAFQLAQYLAAAGLGTPAALACLVLPGREACLVTRFVEARNPWDHLLERGAEQALGPLEQALARSVGRLHSLGFRHRDLKAPNILVRDTPSGPEILFTDLESAARVAVTERVRTRDLARLCMSFESAAARLAGVHADAWPRLVSLYLEHGTEGAGKLATDTLVQRTRRWSARSIERNLMRGRPIA